MRAYEQGERQVVAALHGLKEVAHRMAAALAASDLPQIGRLLSENWQHQQALDSRMCTEEMAQLEHAMQGAGVLGGKAAGSGAGGCRFFLAPDDPSAAIAAARSLGVRLLPVRWAMRGVYQC
jgi:galactokinase/mevalonate kinase-like predicted kinase